MTDPDHCWYMERVEITEIDYLLNNIKDTIRIGRSANLNDKICAGSHVSKQHLKLQRFGAIEDWRNIRWSAIDNNTSNGTYVNTQRIPNSVAYNLNPDDLVGLGCPLNISIKDERHETFVYRVKAPKSLTSTVIAEYALDEEDTDVDIDMGAISDEDGNGPAVDMGAISDEDGNGPAVDMGAISDEDGNRAGPSSVPQTHESPVHPAPQLSESRPEQSNDVLKPVPGPSKPKEKPKVRPCDRNILPNRDNRSSKSKTPYMLNGESDSDLGKESNMNASPSTPTTPIQCRASGGKVTVCEGKDGPIILVSSEDGDKSNSTNNSDDSITEDPSKASSSQIQSPSVEVSSLKKKPKDNDRNEPTTSTASGRKSSDENGGKVAGPKTSVIKPAQKRRRRKSSSSSETKAKSVKAKRVKNLFSSSSDSEVDESPAKKKTKMVSLSKALSLNSESDMELDLVKQVPSLPKTRVPAKSIISRRIEVTLDLNEAKPPKQCLSAMVGTNDKLKWLKVGSEVYKRYMRSCAGLPEDGSKGEPLYLAGSLEDDFSDISDDDNIPDDDIVEVKPSKAAKLTFSDISSEDDSRVAQRDKVAKEKVGTNSKSRPMGCSPISSEEESFVRSAVADTKKTGQKTRKRKKQSQNKGEKKQFESGSNTFGFPSKVKTETKSDLTIKSNRKEESDSDEELPEMNYSQHEIIILDDSDQEDEYSQNILSQSLFKEEKLEEDNGDEVSSRDDESDVEDLLRDSPSPDDFRSEEGDASEDAADEEEIEILETSQNSQLYKMIAKKAYKLEPQEDGNEEESQSLLVPIESQKTSDSPDKYGEMAIDIMNAIKGSDLNMVANARRKARYENNGDPNTDKIMLMVQEEVDNMTIHRISKNKQCPNWVVREIFYALKTDDFGVVDEEELLSKVQERLEEDFVVKKLTKEMEHSSETITEGYMEMKTKGERITENSLRDKVLEKNALEESVANIVEEHGCTELLARKAITEVLDERGRWVEGEVLQKVRDMKEFDQKAASISMELHCDIEEAEEALKSGNNDAQTAAGIIRSTQELRQKSQELSDIFNISVEKASSVLQKCGLNQDLASQNILDDRQTESVIETVGCSLSVSRDEEKDEFDDLLDDIDEDIYSSACGVEDLPKSPCAEYKEGLGKDQEETKSDVSDYGDIDAYKNETDNASPSITSKIPNDESTFKKSNLLDDKKKSILSTKSVMPTPTKNIGTVRPEIKRQQSGPLMIEAPHMPARRAFNRGISQGTVDSILEKEAHASKKTVTGSFFDKKNKVSIKKSDGGLKKTPIKKYTGMFAKRGPDIDDDSDMRNKSKIQAEKKKRLKEIEERKKEKEESAKNKEENRIKSGPSGKMKKSQPRLLKMLEESSMNMTPVPRHKVINGKTSKPIASVPAPAVPRQRHTSGSAPESSRPTEVNQRRISVSTTENTKPAEVSQRRGSASVSVGGFLEQEVALLDTKKKERASKYATSSDGLKELKKMSFLNIEYNVASQDIAKKVIDTTKLKPLPTFGFLPNPQVKKRKKSVRWLDTNGMAELASIRWIEADNLGLKPSSKNRDSVQIPNIKKDGKLKKEIEMNDVFRDILSWTPAWLAEQKKVENKKEPPPVHNKWRVSPVTLAYQSWEDYKSIFVPLMLHELWASITTDVTEKQEASREECIHVCLQEVIKAGKFHQISCIGLLTQHEKDRDLGSAEGTLVQLTLRYSMGPKQANGKQASALNSVFAYVKHVTVAKRDRDVTGEYDLDRLRKLEEAANTTNRKGKPLTWVVRYSMSVLTERLSDERRRLDQDKISMDKPIILTIKSRIKHELRNFQAVIDLPKSKLYDTILKPEAKCFQVGQGSEHLHASIKDVPLLSNLNSLQKRVVVSVSRACSLEPIQPKICLVQGPPGTGKSRTITGIIIQFLCSRGISSANSEPAPRILVVAPSNAAVDELALKLIEAKKEMSGPARDRLNLLRVGREKSMHPKVRAFSFDANMKRIIEKETDKRRATPTLEQDVALKQSHANRLWQRHDEASTEGNEDMAKKFKREWHEMNAQISKIKKTLSEPLEPKARREIEKSATDQIMGGADVILTTLSSSSNSLMEKHFLCDTTRGHRPFSVCIMDEASQCVEPEALIPFKFGFSKLVMVGDHEQLPATVTSRKAKQNDYQQSLFNRFFAYFSSGFGEYVGKSGLTEYAGNTPPMKGRQSPVLRLETQYRMHPAIAEWPSRYFYGGQLVAGPQNRNSSLSPYTVLDTTATEVCKNGQIWNEEEAKYVAQTVGTVRRMERVLSIGVITFYQKQKSVISLELQNKKIATEGPNSVNVNTVDGFQGSERDVIIISCVRGGGDNIGFLADRQRLNVALTRAKFAMIVVGNIQTLKKNSPMFGELVKNANERKCLFSLSSSTNLQAVLSSNR